MSRRYDDDDDDRYSADVRRDTRAEVAARVLPPAILLLVLSVLSLLGLACLLIFFVIMLFVDPPGNQPDDIMGIVLIFGGCSLMLVVKGIIIVGAVQMARVQTYPLAMTAAILQAIPLCSPCWLLEMPLGIWALVILVMPEVRDAFYAENP